MIHTLNNLKSIVRVLSCLGLAVIVAAIAMAMGIAPLTGVMVGWDAFCLLLILLCWTTFFTMSQEQVAHNAQREDESRSTSFVLVGSIVSLSLIGILLLMRSTDGSPTQRALHHAISLLGVAFSWLLLHTLYTLRYAHLYYAGSDAPVPTKGCGLDFPEDDAPDYLDFAYFSFVLGMTFQVSDVEISSKTIRRVALVHSFIAFVFNTTIVALTISIVSNLVGK